MIRAERFSKEWERILVRASPKDEQGSPQRNKAEASASPRPGADQALRERRLMVYSALSFWKRVLERGKLGPFSPLPSVLGGESGVRERNSRSCLIEGKILIEFPSSADNFPNLSPAPTLLRSARGGGNALLNQQSVAATRRGAPVQADQDAPAIPPPQNTAHRPLRRHFCPRRVGAAVRPRNSVIDRRAPKC